MSSEEAKYVKHPSFGVVEISHVTYGMGSGNRPLFGSSILHDHAIQISVHKAEIKRDLSRDWIMPEGGQPIVEVEMSLTQFAEAITSPGKAEETPCTITRIGDQRMPDPPFVNRRVQFDREFKKYVEKVAGEENPYYAEIARIAGKPTIGKKDREDLVKAAQSMREVIASNMGYIKETFSEQMDKTVLEAKGEFEAFIDTKLTRLGLAGFKKELTEMKERGFPALSEKKEG